MESLGGGNMILHFIKQSLVGGEESRLEAGRPLSRLLYLAGSGRDGGGSN